MNSFSQKVKIQQIRSLSEDVRFYYKRIRSNKEDLEPGKKSKVRALEYDSYTELSLELSSFIKSATGMKGDGERKGFCFVFSRSFSFLSVGTFCLFLLESGRRKLLHWLKG